MIKSLWAADILGTSARPQTSITTSNWEYLGNLNMEIQIPSILRIILVTIFNSKPPKLLLILSRQSMKIA